MRIAIICMLLTSSALSHSVGPTKSHKCIHETKFAHIVPRTLPANPSYPSKRILEFAKPKGAQVHLQTPLNWHPLRIEVDYTFSDRFIQHNPSLDFKYRMAKKIVDSVRRYFQSLAQVFYRDSMRFPGGACFNDILPSFEKQADLVVYLSTETDPLTEYNVASTSCYLSDVDERPIVGALVVNYAFLEHGDLQEYL